MTSASAQAQCVGDCNGNGIVVVNELVVGVNIALGLQPLSNCEAFDPNHDGMVTVNELIQGVNNALTGCPVVPTATATGTGTAAATATATPPVVPTATATSPSGDTPTPTVTAEVTATATVGTECPLEAGLYRQTTTGGSLRVATFEPFPFPPGGETILEVGPGDENCVHDIVIPGDGGLIVPAFCVPALGATTLVSQTGCGIGRLDSDGGSDFTVTEQGDTSEVPVCNVPQESCPPAGPAPDSSGRLDVTVGDGTADACESGGTANAIVTIPVNTITWVDESGECPDPDGMYDPDSDTLLAEFPQTLDLTTDSASAGFVDLDENGCSRSGLGPAGPFMNTGECIDIGAMTVAVAASGTIFTSGGPTYDLLFTTQQPATVEGPEAPAGATCDDPPLINFDGLASRCLDEP